MTFNRKTDPANDTSGSKKIILLADGTGNSSSSPHKTNVWRTYKALDVSPGSGQIAYYISGVGTDSFLPLALIGKAFGWGLESNVKEMYAFLCRTYNPGDEICLFGFSRGAFTVRVLAALVSSQGIINVKRRTNDSDEVVIDEADLSRQINRAYSHFREEAFLPSLLSFFGAPLRNFMLRAKDWAFRNPSYDPSDNLEYLTREDAGEFKTDNALIRFIGVWDTVDAYGMPVDEMTRAWDRVVWPLSAKDRDLSPRVQHARHALSLDEQRQTFEPMLWNEEDEPCWATTERPKLSSKTKAMRKEQRSILQVWFAGVHSNIGGGYPDDGLAHVSLEWMLDEAKTYAGLKFLESDIKVLGSRVNPLGPSHDSRAWFGNVYRLDPRNLLQLGNFTKPGFLGTILPGSFDLIDVGKINKVKVAKPIIHQSVFNRISHDGNGYAPINIPVDYACYNHDGSISDQVSKTPYETQDQAAARHQAQQIIWNKVWYRKVIYAVTLFLSLIFLAYPYLNEIGVRVPFLAKYSGAQEQWVGTIAAVVREVPGLISKVPGAGIASGWFEAYEAHPFPFSILLGTIIALVLTSLSIDARSRAQMHQYWAHLNNSEPAELDQRPWSRNMAGFLLGDTYGKFRKAWRVFLEAFMVVLFLAFVCVGAMFLSRVVFFAGEFSGFHCDPLQNAENKLGEPFTFNPKETCQATGITVKAGKIYAIEMHLDGEWRDEKIESDVRGWKEETNPDLSKDWEELLKDQMIIFATPLRRHVFVPWYQPVARIDDHWFDRFPLVNEKNLFDNLEWERLQKAEHHHCLRSSFSPKDDDQLYLYLNDAVLLWPSLVDRFYQNNEGTATIKVTEISTDSWVEIPDPICTYAASSK